MFDDAGIVWYLILWQTTPCCTKSYCAISYHTVPYNTLLGLATHHILCSLYCIVPDYSILIQIYTILPYRFILYYTIQSIQRLTTDRFYDHSLFGSAAQVFSQLGGCTIYFLSSWQCQQCQLRVSSKLGTVGFLCVCLYLTPLRCLQGKLSTQSLRPQRWQQVPGI